MTQKSAQGGESKFEQRGGSHSGSVASGASLTSPKMVEAAKRAGFDLKDL